MADFLTQAACRGIKPRKLDVCSFRSRFNLVSKLMGERHVARFIIAPDGFGKTTLACEYADVVFSFQHVFWIDCSSPCFLRDLDKGDLAASIVARDRDLKLVVFDNVPLLGEERAESFSLAMDLLLNKGVEVLALMPPSGDAYQSLQTDRLVVGSRDLLLDEAELLVAQGFSLSSRNDHLTFFSQDMDVAELAGSSDTVDAPASRIASMVWGGDSAGQAVIEGLAREDLTIEMRAWCFVALVLRNAIVDETPFLPRLDTESLEFLARCYPYVGLSDELGELSTVSVDLGMLAKAFASSIPAIAQAAHFEDTRDFVVAVADALLGQDRCSDACVFVRWTASAGLRASWLASNGRRLFELGAFTAAHMLFNSIRAKRTVEGSELVLMQAWRMLVLGNTEGACACATRVAKSTYSSSASCAYAALLLANYGNPHERVQAEGTIRFLMQCSKVAAREEGSLAGNDTDAVSNDNCAAADIPETEGSSWKSPASSDCSVEELCRAEYALLSEPEASWRAVAALWLSRRVAVASVEKVWDFWLQSNASEQILCAAGAWLLRERGELLPDSILEYLRERIERMAEGTGRLDAYTLYAGVCYTEACSAFNFIPLSAMASKKIARGRTAVLLQKGELQRAALKEAQRERSAEQGGQGDSSVHPTRISQIIDQAPTLRLKLLGGMEVYLGDRLIEDGEFVRAKCKTLLAVLALADGREICRNNVIDGLWPDSPISCARRNLYTVWSQLRHTLALESGMCPYVQRRQGAFRIDDRLVTSDVSRVNTLCYAMTSRKTSTASLDDILEEFIELYTGDLLPGETENESIVRERDDLRKRAVNSLLAAAYALERQRDGERTLAFAKTAYALDRNREDVYTTLMRAQILAGQRTPAMETYFECQRFLSDELGILPSAETVGLYESIIAET